MKENQFNLLKFSFSATGCTAKECCHVLTLVSNLLPYLDETWLRAEITPDLEAVKNLLVTLLHLSLSHADIVTL